MHVADEAVKIWIKTDGLRHNNWRPLNRVVGGLRSTLQCADRSKSTATIGLHKARVNTAFREKSCDHSGKAN